MIRFQLAMMLLFAGWVIGYSKQTVGVVCVIGGLSLFVWAVLKPGVLR